MTETLNSSPVSDLIAEAKASSIASTECDLSGFCTGKPSIELIGAHIQRLALVFPLNSSAAESDPNGMFEVYANLMSGYTDTEVRYAFLVCAKRLKRMPYPADLIEVITEQNALIAAIDK